MMRWIEVALVVSLGATSATAGEDQPLTLDAALAEARAANARLPVAAIDVDVSREKIREARAELWLKVAMEGDFIYSPASSYDPAVTNTGELRAQLIGRQHLFDGGGRRAVVRRAEADLVAAGARYRIAEKDLDLEVRSRFAELLNAESEIEARSEGNDRLKSYGTSLKSRLASGQGIAADLLKTEVHQASGEADLVEARRHADEARFGLNDLLGRDPMAPLSLVPLPPPAAPLATEAEPWVRAPELAQAAAETQSAQEGLGFARSERKLHMFASADVGLWGGDTTHWSGFFDRARGYSLSLNFSWPLWDYGGMRARLTQATLGVQQAKKAEEVERRRARIEWERAQMTLLNVYQEIEILSKEVPDARDAYLDAESRYRGGAATSLEVLDAHGASVDASVRLADAVMRYRVAQALELRWGSQ
jgi:outer membrane protein TolC